MDLTKKPKPTAVKSQEDEDDHEDRLMEEGAAAEDENLYEKRWKDMFQRLVEFQEVGYLRLSSYCIRVSRYLVEARHDYFFCWLDLVNHSPTTLSLLCCPFNPSYRSTAIARCQTVMNLTHSYDIGVSYPVNNWYLGITEQT